MPINWSVLNPSLPAQMQTINPFAALNAGRAQAEERIQNQQASALRGMQVKGLEAELADNESGKKAAALAMQAFQAHQQDPTSSIPILQQAFELNPQTAFNTFKSLQEQARASEKGQLEISNSRAELANRNAPIVLAALDAADKGKPEDGLAILEQAGILDQNVHAQVFADPAKRAQMRQAAENQPSIIKQRREEEAARRAEENRRRDDEARDRRLEHYLAGGNRDRGVRMGIDENGNQYIEFGGSGGPAGTTVQNSQAQLLLALNAAQPSWEQYGKALFDPRLSPTAAGATGAVLGAVRGVSNQIPFTRSVAEWADKQLPVKLNDRQAQQMRYMAETLELQLAPVFSAASKGNPSNKDLQRVREAIGVLGTTDDLNRARFAYGYIDNYMTTLRTQAESVTGSGRLPAPRGMRPVIPPATTQPAPTGGPRRMTPDEIRARLRGG